MSGWRAMSARVEQLNSKVFLGWKEAKDNVGGDGGRRWCSDSAAPTTELQTAVATVERMAAERRSDVQRGS